MNTYEVTVDGYGGGVFAGETPGQARACAWRNFTDACECSFKEFLQRSRITRVNLPDSAGYEYVKRAYGVDARAGQKVKLRNEDSWNGTVGLVVYPGKSTAHVHVKVEGVKRILIVHPDNVEIQ